MVLDIFALVVILIIIALVITLVVYLGPLPGKIAEQRGNPQADAIRVLGWIGLITLGTGWLIALVWAYIRTSPGVSADPQLEHRIASLEESVRDLAGKGEIK